MVENSSGRAPTQDWHRIHDCLDRCDKGHVRLDEILFDADPAPEHRLAWPTRPLEPGDQIAAVRVDADGADAEGFLCYDCYRRRTGLGRNRWRVVTQAERDQLPPTGCSRCSRPWPRSAFAATAWMRSIGSDREPYGVLCARCTCVAPDGRWFQPSGRRRSPFGRAWWRPLTERHPALEMGFQCVQCGQRFGQVGPVEIIGEATAAADRPVLPGKARYPRGAADSGLTPPWPYLCHPWDLLDATARFRHGVDQLCTGYNGPCYAEPAHSRACHEIAANLGVYRGTRMYGPAFRNWYLAARQDVSAVAWRVSADAAGPYACHECGSLGRVPFAQPVSLRQLLTAAVPPPASGVACAACAMPVIPERWHPYSRPHQRHSFASCRIGERCHACAPCAGPHLRRDEVLRPPGYLAGTYGARATRELRPDDVIGGVIGGPVEQLLCPACYARGRRGARPHRPLHPGDRPGLPAGCDRCHRPWPLSAWREPEPAHD